jgi:hypothetical protein
VASPSPPLESQGSHREYSNTAGIYAAVNSPVLQRHDVSGAYGANCYLSANSASSSPMKSPRRCCGLLQRSMSTRTTPMSPSPSNGLTLTPRRYSDEHPAKAVSFSSPTRALSPPLTTGKDWSARSGLATSPAYSTSPRSSPMLSHRRITSPLSSAADSDASPPEESSPSSPGGGGGSHSHPITPSSPILRASSRRMLPETPTRGPGSRSVASMATITGSSGGAGAFYPSRVSSSSSPSSSLTDSRHRHRVYVRGGGDLLGATGDRPNAAAWQSMSSHDSFDSGFYSRSTTSDSRHLSSPTPPHRRLPSTSTSSAAEPTSPLFTRRRSWRRSETLHTVADPRGSNGGGGNYGRPSNEDMSTIGLEWELTNATDSAEDVRRRSLPVYKSLLLEREPAASTSVRDPQVGFYRPSRYGSVREGVVAAGGGGHRLPRSRETAELTSRKERLVAGVALSGVHRVHFDPDLNDDDHGNARFDRGMARRGYRRDYGETTEEEALKDDLQDKLHKPLTTSISNPPTPSALLSSAAAATASHLRSVISSAQSYGRTRLIGQQPTSSSSSSPPVAEDSYAGNEAGDRCNQQPLILEVPKLRDLKSHSFPPPWARDSIDREQEEEEADASVDEGNEERDGQEVEDGTGQDSDDDDDSSDDNLAVNPCTSALHAGPLPATSAYCEVPAAFFPFLDPSQSLMSASEALNRRRRWILQAHTFSENR